MESLVQESSSMQLLLSRYPPRLKYWMPIHYDITKDGQNKKSHLLFSFLVRSALLLQFLLVELIRQKILLRHYMIYHT